jgi:hypothetical protein
MQGLDCKPRCRIPGEMVLDYFSADAYSREQSLGLLALFVVGHRLLFVAALIVRDALAGRAWLQMSNKDRRFRGVGAC